MEIHGKAILLWTNPWLGREGVPVALYDGRGCSARLAWPGCCHQPSALCHPSGNPFVEQKSQLRHHPMTMDLSKHTPKALFLYLQYL